MYIIVSYCAYLTVSIGTTIWVARTLHRNGRAFLVDAFHELIEFEQRLDGADRL